MINEFDSALRMTRGLLLAYDHVTEENIDEAVEQIRMLQKGGGLLSVDLNTLRWRLMEISNAVVSELDDLTDTILDKLFDPNQRGIELQKKGLVVGQVQSGKTSNYTGLICKAADAGFNFVIVLAGMHNNLRSQTQLRLDEGFLGFDTQYERAYNLHSETRMGVGKLPTPHNHPVAHSFTSSFEKGDFNKP